MTMVSLEPDAMPFPPPPKKPSMFASLMNAYKAQSAAIMRFLWGDNYVLHHADNYNRHDDNDRDLLRWVLGAPRHGAGHPNANFVDNRQSHRQLRPTKTKRKRTKYPRMNQKDSLWWRMFLEAPKRNEVMVEPNGRLAEKFRKLFHVPFQVFLELRDVANEEFWTEWTEDRKCRAGKLVSNLELKILGALFVLATGDSHFVCSTCSNISEEVHRSFFLKWIFNMTSIKERYIHMPLDDASYQKVVGEYTARGFPGCVGSVDCVHIGWDRCPVQYTNMYKGKEGYTSVAYEVICTCRKFIQSVSVGHPGTRNDKHISRTDESVTDLLVPNSWLSSKIWQCLGPNGQKRNFFGAYLICDGGYHKWPCLIFPWKKGLPNSPAMMFSKKLESVRKDIEGVFGILKVRFRFLKTFNLLSRQDSIDNAFVTCCILHNIMLRHDGYLAEDLTPYPGGLEEALAKQHGGLRWNGTEGMWVRDGSDQNEVATYDNQPPLVSTPFPLVHTEAETRRLRVQWERVTNALVDHHEYCRTRSGGANRDNES